MISDRLKTKVADEHQIINLSYVMQRMNLKTVQFSLLYYVTTFGGLSMYPIATPLVVLMRLFVSGLKPFNITL